MPTALCHAVLHKVGVKSLVSCPELPANEWAMAFHGDMFLFRLRMLSAKMRPSVRHQLRPGNRKERPSKDPSRCARMLSSG
jgi:hypothetical protein